VVRREESDGRRRRKERRGILTLLVASLDRAAPFSESVAGGDRT
jgi:hypothetical protein